MKIVFEGWAHRHDLIQVSCKFCDTIVKFWRDEPGTKVDYIDQGEIDGKEGSIYVVYWTCPICGSSEATRIGERKDNNDTYWIGIEKGHVMSKAEKVEMKAAMEEQ